jgi:4-hydroxymandelate oxidase
VDPARTRSLVERAAAAGYGAIVLTVDLPELGYRDRDRRSGFSLDVPHGNFRDGAEPTHGSHATDDDDGTGADPGEDVEAVDQWIAKNLTWDSLATIRSWSPLPLVLKGILTGEDARLAVEHGVDAIVVSNHGGRQLDRSPAAIDVLGGDRRGCRTARSCVDGGVRCDRHRDRVLARRAGRARRPGPSCGPRRRSAGVERRSRSCARSSSWLSSCSGRRPPGT